MPILYLLLYFILCVSLPSELFLFNIRPDLLLILVIFTALFNLKKYIYIVFFAGLFKDIASGGFFGLNIFCFALWALIVSQISRHFYKDNKYIFSAVVAVATFANYITYIILNSFFVEVGLFGALLEVRFLFMTILVEAMYNVLFSYFLFDVFKKAVKRYRIPQQTR